MRKRVLCGVLLLLLLSGCGVPPESPPGGAFTDDLGREVPVEQPRRVAALMGGFAEIWILAGGELVAVTDDAISERSLELGEGVVNLGFYTTPSMESLLSSSPDLVLLSAQTPSHVDLLDTLEQADIHGAAFDVTHFPDYLRMLDLCTGITGRPDLYERNGLAVEAEIGEILAGIPQGNSPSALLLITHSGGAVVQRSDTMTGRMLEELGCVNLADKDPSLLKDMSMEHIIAQDPDFIFVIPMGNSSDLARQHLRELVEEHPAWASLRAVRENRYILLPKEGFLYKPNHKWADSYRFLAEVLYEQG